MEKEKSLQVSPVPTGPLTNLMESPEKAVVVLNSIKNNFQKLLKDNREIITIKTKSGKADYVKYEGWVTIATVLGVFPRVIDLQELSPGMWQAKAEVVNVKTGQVVGSGYGICSKKEALWGNRADFSVASMAQTRACGRALKSILSGVITHMGYEGDPAEIVEPEANPQGKVANSDGYVKNYSESTGPSSVANHTTAGAGGSTPNQQKAIYAILKGKGKSDEDVAKWLMFNYDVEHTRDLTKAQASEAIDKLNNGGGEK